MGASLQEGKGLGRAPPTTRAFHPGETQSNAYTAKHGGRGGRKAVWGTVDKADIQVSGGGTGGEEGLWPRFQGQRTPPKPQKRKIAREAMHMSPGC